MEDTTDYSYFNQLCYPPPSPNQTSPYLSPTAVSHNRSEEEDLFNSLSPDSAHRWQSQQQVASQPINITSPFISPVGKSRKKTLLEMC